ncbi:MAG: flagellar FliJ family protein, partial [Betaproteobacteria bacterium]|nr:flagellar FliJ family protein [Betaproteobacteria bacterium]
MAIPSALNTLIDLANKETDAAAKQLGAALHAGEEAEQKLELLMQYRDDYAARCQSTLTTGISTTQLNNFQVFMQ